MRIIIPKTSERELKTVSKYFSEIQIKKAAQKAYKGLGSNIPTSMKKIYLTSNSVAGRALFLVKKEKEVVVLVLIRVKNDRVGENMSYQNPEFSKILDKNLPLILEDIEKGDYRVL